MEKRWAETQRILLWRSVDWSWHWRATAIADLIRQSMPITEQAISYSSGDITAQFRTETNGFLEIPENADQPIARNAGSKQWLDNYVSK